MNNHKIKYNILIEFKVIISMYVCMYIIVYVIFNIV